jgi:hypothetical protein
MKEKLKSLFVYFFGKKPDSKPEPEPVKTEPVKLEPVTVLQPPVLHKIEDPVAPQAPEPTWKEWKRSPEESAPKVETPVAPPAAKVKKPESKGKSKKSAKSNSVKKTTVKKGA